MAKPWLNICAAALFIPAVLAGCEGSREPAGLRKPAAELWLAPGRAPAQAPKDQSFGLVAAPTRAAALAPIIGLGADQVCQGMTFRGSSGATVEGQKLCTLPACTAGKLSDCLTTAGYRSVDLSYVQAQRSQFYPALTIAGVKGELGPLPIPNCQRTGDSDCLSTSKLRAIAKSIIHPGVIKKGVALDGSAIVGEYPSAKYPPTPIPAGSIALTPKNLKEALRSTKTYHFWTVFGELRTITGDNRLHGNNIRAGLSTYGVTGKGAATAGPLCTAAGSRSCVVTSSWLSLNPADLDPKTVRQGVAIAGVSGQYPSAAAPLAASSPGVADLQITASHWGQLSQDELYEYFDNEGRRYTVTGTTALAPHNLADQQTILGVVGSFQGLDPGSVDPVDIRKGLAIGAGKVGSLDLAARCTTKANCLQGHWRRLEADGKLSTAPCESTGNFCVLRNLTQRQDWLFDTKSAPMTWQEAAESCENLEHLGAKDWRMPSQKELMQAAVNGLGSAGPYDFYSQPISELKFWSATIFEGANVVTYSPEDALFASETTTNTARGLCVRTP